MKVCKRCVLDNKSANLIFDAAGVCNYCNNNTTNISNIDVAFDQLNLARTISKIKETKKSKNYNCIIGLSGGVDSSYLAYLAVKKFGLKPLAVHFDNGWNSNLAVENVHNLVSKLKLDLRTYVIKWDEFKDLQLAYLKSSVVDIEVPTDHFIMATMHKYAHENGIKYILNGCNHASESIMPSGWNFPKEDLANLLDIHRKYGTLQLKKFPSFGLKKRLFYQHIVGIKQVYPLNYLNYKIDDAKDILSNKLDWKDYGGKHFESVWTRFYQGYILPKKFNIDKRRAHYSSLILSQQMNRGTALELLNEPPYPVKNQLEDKEYVLKKLSLSRDEFNQIMASPKREHGEFKTENKYINIWTSFFLLLEAFIFYISRPKQAAKYFKYKFSTIF